MNSQRTIGASNSWPGPELGPTSLRSGRVKTRALLDIRMSDSSLLLRVCRAVALLGPTGPALLLLASTAAAGEPACPASTAAASPTEAAANPDFPRATPSSASAADAPAQGVAAHSACRLNPANLRAKPVAGLTAEPPPARAGATSDNLLRQAFTGIALMAGATVVAAEKLASAALPGTQVLVQREDGTRVPGTLSREASRGRVVHAGDTVSLRCQPNQPPLAGAWGAGTCQLEFLAVPARPSSPDYYERIGRQPGWTLGMNGQGAPDSALLVLHPWPADPKLP